ncbi:hypothetical protein YWS52_26290 [Chitiniphilus shinanonensis]
MGSEFVSDWDREWFHHFSVGGYASIEWVEIKVTDPAQANLVLDALRTIHLPVERLPDVFKIIGHFRPGTWVDYPANVPKR